MKICPRCKKEYDDTWTICFHCSTDLVATDEAISAGDPAPAANPADVEAIRTELKGLRKQASVLIERVNFLEYKISQYKEKASPEKPKPTVKEPVQEAVKPPEPPKPALSRQKERAWEPAEPERKSLAENFEQILGGKWFHKLGILAVVVGVALLLGYSFQYLGPVGKVGIGYAFGIGMLVLGHVLEKREGFSRYGKGLIGGAWAIVYFTTFAMHHVPEVRLVANPFIGMAFLLAASAAAVTDIYRYKSEAATGFAYLLVFITLMTSPISIYTMAAMVPVAISLVFFMIRMNWAGFGIYGMAMTYTVFLGWFGIARHSGIQTMTLQQFSVEWSFLLLYWAIFTVGAVLARRKEGEAGLVGSRELGLILNTVIASLCGLLLVSAGFLRFGQPALLLGAVLYFLLTVATYVRGDRPLYLISSTFSVIFAALFLTVRFAGYTLTVSYLILAQAVLLVGIVLKERYWRLLAFGSLFAILAKLLTYDSFTVKNTALAAHLSTRTILFAIAFAAYLGNHFLYGWLKKTGRLTDAERNHDITLSYIYPLIYAMGTWLDLPKVLTAPCWIILGVILLQIGVTKNNYHQRIQGYILCIGSFLRLLMSNMLVMGGISIFSYRILTSIPVLLLLYYCVMILQDKKTKDILMDSEKKMIFVFPYMVFAVIMFLVWYEVPKDVVAPVWGVIAIAYSLRGIYSKEKHYLSISSLAALSAGARAVFVNIFQGKYLVGAEGNIIFPIITIGALYLGNVLYLISKEALKEIEGKGESRIRVFLRSSRLIYSIVATLLLTTLLIVKLQGVLLTVSLGIEGMMLFLLGFGIKEKYWRMFGLAILLLTLGKAFLVDLRQLSTIYYIVCLIGLGLALLFVSYVYTKNKDKFKKLK